MIERIKNILASLAIDDYLIRETSETRLEGYYVRRALDMKRSAEYVEYAVSVYHSYRDGEEEYLGSSDALLFASMSDEEIGAKLTAAYTAASYVRTPAYPHAPAHTDVREGAHPTLSAIAEGFREALYRYDVDEDAFINSAEIFVASRYTRLVSSGGVDVGYPSLECSGELVVQCKGAADVELFDYFRYDGECYDALADRVRDKLRAVRDRAAAEINMPSGEYDVILEGECVRTLLGYALFQASAKNIYTGYSSASAGERLHGIYPDLTVIPTSPYSREGLEMSEQPLTSDGRLSRVIGGMRFSSYLGTTPTGEYERIRAESGDMPLSEMKKDAHLYIVAFSDFQFDELDGYFGGEVRLGYYYDGQSIRAVTGFSVSGNFRTAESVAYSRGRYIDYTYDGPACVRIGGVSVN